MGKNLIRTAAARSDSTSAELLESLRQQNERFSALKIKLEALETELGRLQTEKEALTQELLATRNEKAELEWVFENALDLYCAHDSTGKAIRINRACEALLGYTQEEFLDTPMEALAHPDELEQVRRNIANVMAGADSIGFESRLRHKNGSWRWFAWTCPGQVNAAGPVYAIARDVTESKLSAETLLYRAQYDSLTGLANRALFEQSLSQAVSRALRSPPLEVALLLFDLDGFKLVNDVHGHGAGDVVLQTVAQRLMPRQRAGELICRLGGDEFAWILEGPTVLEAVAVADFILEQVRQPVCIDSTFVTVSCSIGAAYCPRTAANADELRRQADSAMYEAKRRGKNLFWSVDQG